MKRSFNLSWAIFACFFGLLAILEALVLAYYTSVISVVGFLLVYAVGVTFFLSVLCYLSGFFGRKIFCGAISLFFVLAMACSKMSLNDFLISLPEGVIATFLILLFSALFFLFLHMEKKRLFPTLGLYVATGFILVSYPIFLTLKEIHAASKENVEEESVELEDTLTDWSGIEFSEKPHIFIISYDSMIPQETAEQYMGLKPAYQAVLDEEFIEFKKGVVLRVSSQPSLNAVMRLDQVSLRRGSGYFIGDKPSALSVIAHANGYKIVTGYFGQQRKKNLPPAYLDEYLSIAATFIRSSVCIDVRAKLLMKSRGYFICKGHNIINQYFPAFTRIFFPDKKPWSSTVYNHIRNLAEDDPHISFFYIYDPIGHTSSGFDYNNATHLKEYKKMFSSQSGKLTLELNTLVALIKGKHPDSILLVFGDHGAYLSRRVKRPSTAQEVEFFFKDRHRVALALMKTKNRCVKGFQVDENRGYYTPSMVLVELFECLESSNVLPSLIDYDEHQKELLLEHAF